MKKPVIGVTPLYDEDKKSIWMLSEYLRGIEEAGGLPVILPYTDDPDALDQCIEICDGILITGGQDVNPEYYHEQVKPTCGIINDIRDAQDRYLIMHAVNANKPLLGICRGEQMMNVVYGGTMYQDLLTEFDSKISHRMNKPYDQAIHNVAISGPLEKLFKTGLLGVNSLHHQAVKDMSPMFEIMAVAEDGLVEGIYMPSRSFIWGLQWHPEFMYHKQEGKLIFEAFINACINNIIK